MLRKQNFLKFSESFKAKKKGYMLPLLLSVGLFFSFENKKIKKL